MAISTPTTGAHPEPLDVPPDVFLPDCALMQGQSPGIADI
jgi:hypothetical protein